MTFAMRQARRHASRLGLLALIAAVVVAGIGGIDALSGRMIATGASQMLTNAEPASRTVRIVATSAQDQGAQDTAVRDAISVAFAGTDVVVARQITAEVQASGAVDELATGAGEELAIALLDDARLPELATLTAGTWPTGPGEVALPVAAANRAHLAVGDVVTLPHDGSTLEVVGTWSAKQPDDPAWHGDPAVASGMSDGAIGPAAVAAGTLINLASSSKTVWEIMPDRALVDVPDEIPQLQRGLAKLEQLADTVDPQRVHNTRVLGAQGAGSLGETLTRVSTAITATRGLLIAPQLIIGLLGALVLGIVLSALVAARAEELALLRARGASAARLALAHACEALVAALIGAALAVAVLAITVGVTAPTLWVTLGTLAFAASAAALFVLRRALSADVVRPDAQRSDAGARTLRLLLFPAGIAVAAATLAAWQLFSARSVVTASGTANPLAAAAPALMLIAACTLVPLAAGPLAALAERFTSRTRGIAPTLPLRQILRRMGGAAVAMLCLALAAAALAVAAAAPAVRDSADERSRAAILGGDVRVITEDGLEVTAADAAAWAGVTHATEVLRTPVTFGRDTIPLVASDPQAMRLSDGTGETSALPTPNGQGGGDATQGVAVAMSQSLANRLGASVGTTLTARVRTVVDPVPFVVIRIADDLPGIGDAWGLAAHFDDIEAVGAKLRPNELWLRSDDPDETVSAALEHSSHPARILTAARVSQAAVTSAAPTLLIIGACVAAMLGVTGFIAAAGSGAGGRRDEAIVLRSLGLTPARQRAMRVGETAGVAMYAAVVGAALGAGIAFLVLPMVLGVGS